MTELFWKRIRDGVYEGRDDDGSVVATVERFDPPTNSNFSIWSVVGVTGGNFSTLKDAKAFVESDTFRNRPRNRDV